MSNSVQLARIKVTEKALLSLLPTTRTILRIIYLNQLLESWHWLYIVYTWSISEDLRVVMLKSRWGWAVASYASLLPSQLCRPALLLVMMALLACFLASFSSLFPILAYSLANYELMEVLFKNVVTTYDHTTCLFIIVTLEDGGWYLDKYMSVYAMYLNIDPSKVSLITL